MKINPGLQHRSMEKDGIIDLLSRAEVGRIATINSDGTPYIVPVHFAFEDGRIFVHCARNGKKLENIALNPSVCFEVDELLGYSIGEKPCSSTTFYRSVIVSGKARIVDDRERKEYALGLINKKHTGSDGFGKMPAISIDATCVIEVEITSVSGKRHEG